MSTTTIAITTQQHANHNCRTFHTRRRFPQGCVEVGDCGYGDKLGRRQLAFLNSILAIHGVERVTCGGYAIDVTKGEAFAWGELESLILRRVSEYAAVPAPADGPGDRSE